MRKNQKGFSYIELLVILVTITAISLIGYTIYSKNHKTKTTVINKSNSTAPTTSTDSNAVCNVTSTIDTSHIVPLGQTESNGTYTISVNKVIYNPAITGAKLAPNT